MCVGLENIPVGRYLTMFSKDYHTALFRENYREMARIAYHRGIYLVVCLFPPQPTAFTTTEIYRKVYKHCIGEIQALTLPTIDLRPKFFTDERFQILDWRSYYHNPKTNQDEWSIDEIEYAYDIIFKELQKPAYMLLTRDDRPIAND